MKSNALTKKKVAQENKKPPFKESENQPQPENIEITEELEKKMYEGQEHIEETSQDQLDQQKLEEEKPKEKKQMIVKPREAYLQEKITKMNCNKNLMSNIQKELGDKVKTIIKDDNVLITEVTKDLNKFIKKEPDGQNGKDMEQKFEDKQKYKEVKKLNDELLLLKKNLKQIEENEKLLQEEGFTQLSNSQKGINNNSMFDKSIKEQQLKAFQDKKDKLNESIKAIEYQIKNIMEGHNTSSNKEKLKSFIDNFERDKEIVEIRAKKYLKEAKERNKRMKNDINQLMEKRKKEIEEKDKEEKSKKDELIKKMKEQEKVIEQKQSKMNEEIMLKYKPFINQKPEKTKKDYLYNKRYENYKKQQEKLFKDKTNQNKKEKEKVSYKFEDIDKFAEEYDEKLENRKYEQEQKNMKISEQWAKNKENLPKCNYQEPINDKINLDEEKIETQDLPIHQYGRKVRENHIPEISQKKKEEREAMIKALEEPKSGNNKKYTLNKQKQKRVLLKKRDNSKPSKFKWELKLETNETEKYESINQNLIRKPKKVNLKPITRMSTRIPNKKPDYLHEIIAKKEEKIRANSSKARQDMEDMNNMDSEIGIIEEKSKKWEKEINNKKGSLIDNINNIQAKTKIIDQEADMKEKLLKVNGGIENNPELGKKVTNLIIDSIQAKINILKKMNEVK